MKIHFENLFSKLATSKRNDDDEMLNFSKIAKWNEKKNKNKKYSNEMIKMFNTLSDFVSK